MMRTKNEPFEAAIAYLDNNKTWHRDSLENFDETKGLFDALNTYDYDKLIDLNAGLGSSTSYNTLIETVDSCKKFMKTKVGSEYNVKNDSLINWERYAEKLKNGQKKQNEARTSTTADASIPRSKLPNTPNTNTISSSDNRSSSNAADTQENKKQSQQTKDTKGNGVKTSDKTPNRIRI